MPARNVERFFNRRLIAASLAGMSAFSIASIPARAAEGWPAGVDAVYKIHFSGLDLGEFTYSSRVQQNSYSATSNAQISAMFGAYEWKGQSRSAGTTVDAGPKPASYAFNFKNQSKIGSVSMAFTGNAVTNVSAVPPIERKPGTIEVKDTHLKDVLDPLSAVMALTRAASAGKVAGVNPCARRIPIFDGKQRFDLVFSPKRTAPLAEIGSKSPHMAFVCRVKYVPIAGYRMNEDMRQMQQATGIEVWMVPLAEANVFVPYYVLIPLTAGTATLTASRVNIDTARGKVALH
jgi:Protein of unknown function (DUF3108)